MSTTQSRTFFGAPLCLNLDELTADVAILGVPFSQTTFAPGVAAYGPAGVRDTSAYLYSGLFGDTPAAGYYDIDADRDFLKGVTMADCGDVAMLSHDVERNFATIEATIRRILDRGAFPVVVGGDHSISIAVCRALERYRPVDLIHFDAHQDFMDSYKGVLYTSGTPIRRISELSFINHITSIGIRGAFTTNRRDYEAAIKRGVVTITASRFRELGPEKALGAIPNAPFIYVTLDTDVLDPSYVPGTRVPSLGGLSYLEMKAALQEVAKKGKVVGLDVVEVAPPKESNVTPLVAGQLIIDLLSVLFPSK
jgi:agmatinase